LPVQVEGPSADSELVWEAQLSTRKVGDPHPFVDPASWDARAKRSLETAQGVLAQEQAKAPK